MLGVGDCSIRPLLGSCAVEKNWWCCRPSIQLLWKLFIISYSQSSSKAVCPILLCSITQSTYEMERSTNAIIPRILFFYISLSAYIFFIYTTAAGIYIFIDIYKCIHHFDVI